MNYRVNSQNGDNLSILGFGCMRFETSMGKINESAAISKIHRAIDLGINYFDTAYIYHAGKSEEILGKALKNGLREKVKIADKLPHYMVRKSSDIEKLFQTQLTRLQTTYIDYYLVHMLMDTATLDKLLSLGFAEWVEQKKKSGQIRNIGFSFHGKGEEFLKLLDAYPWEFCQIQYNYMDEYNQAGKAGLLKAAEKNLPVIIMEPLRGGKLVTHLPPEVLTLFKGRDPAEMALRWIWNHEQATVVLSGMTLTQQMEDNARYASGDYKLTAEELSAFDEIKAIMRSMTKIPCTGCGYCMPCPAGVDIPACFSVYNERDMLGKSRNIIAYLRDTGALTKHPGYASKCMRCGKCEPHCPQSIPIRESLSEVSGAMEGIFFKIAKTFGPRFM